MVLYSGKDPFTNLKKKENTQLICSLSFKGETGVLSPAVEQRTISSPSKRETQHRPGQPCNQFPIFFFSESNKLLWSCVCSGFSWVNDFVLITRLSVKVMHILVSQSVLCVTAGFLSLQTQEVNSDNSGAYVMVTSSGQQKTELRWERK